MKRLIALIALIALSACDDGSERMRTVVSVKASNSMTLQMGEPTECEVRDAKAIAGGWFAVLACETSLATVTAEMKVIPQGNDYLWDTDQDSILVRAK